MTIRIRPATTQDATVLARMRYEFRAGIGEAREHEASFVDRCESWMSSRLAGARDWWAWVAEDHGEVIGNVWLHRIEKMPNPVTEFEAHGYITNMYVRPLVRGGGTGSALLTAALEHCDREHMDTIILWPTPRSRSLYERHGFTVRNDQMSRKCVR
jgi:GNAT superfamily N-acetyltransferase